MFIRLPVVAERRRTLAAAAIQLPITETIVNAYARTTVARNLISSGNVHAILDEIGKDGSLAWEIAGLLKDCEVRARLGARNALALAFGENLLPAEVIAALIEDAQALVSSGSYSIALGHVRLFCEIYKSAEVETQKLLVAAFAWTFEKALRSNGTTNMEEGAKKETKTLAAEMLTLAGTGLVSDRPLLAAARDYLSVLKLPELRDTPIPAHAQAIVRPKGSSHPDS